MTRQGPSTCQHLPPELLGSIFHFLYTDDTIPRTSKGDSSHKLLTLMLVCKSFDQIIQSTSAFWTELWLVRTLRNTDEQEASWIEWIGKQITKSGELPLRVFFVLSSLSLRKIFPILLPTSPRWAHLTITPLFGANEPLSDPKILQRLFNAPIPQLRSLSVGGLGKWVDTVFDIGTVFRHAPRLVELEWHDRFVVFRPDNGKAGNAEEYVRFKTLQGGTYDLAQNTLEVLSIQGSTPPITLEPMVMHRLRRLSLGGSSKPWSFLGRWQLPVLEELHISGNPNDQVEAPESPIFPALKRIEWLDAESDPTPADTQSDDVLLGILLAASPELQSFEFSIFTGDRPALSYLIARTAHRQPTDRIWPFLETDDATGTPKYCPQLQELGLQEAGFEEVERLVDIRPQLEKVELVALRRDTTTSSLQEDLERLEKVKERVDVIFQEWV